MTLEWTDPPRDHRDDAAERAAQLHNRPGTWARVRNGGRYDHDFLDCLYGLDIEYRVVNERTVEIDGRIRRVADLYARAPKEAE